MSGLHAHVGLTGRALGYREVQVLALVWAAASGCGYAEIRDALGFSDKRDARAVVQRLERRSLVRRENRGVTVIALPPAFQPELQTAAGGGCGHAG